MDVAYDEDTGLWVSVRPRIVEERLEDGTLVVKHFFDDDSLTKQEFLQESDVNFVVDRYRRNGIPLVEVPGAQYRDVSQCDSLLDAYHQIEDAKHSFAKLDARVRAQFNNDVFNFIEFLDNPENHDKLEAMNIKVAEDSVSYQEKVGEPVGEPTKEEK